MRLLSLNHHHSCLPVNRRTPHPHQDLPIAKSSSFVPHEENIDGSQSKRVNNETHGLLDVAMKSELAEGTLDNDEDVIEPAIPEEQVPVRRRPDL